MYFRFNNSRFILNKWHYEIKRQGERDREINIETYRWKVKREPEREREKEREKKRKGVITFKMSFEDNFTLHCSSIQISKIYFLN